MQVCVIQNILSCPRWRGLAEVIPTAKHGDFVGRGVGSIIVPLSKLVCVNGSERWLNFWYETTRSTGTRVLFLVHTSRSRKQAFTFPPPDKVFVGGSRGAWVVGWRSPCLSVCVAGWTRTHTTDDEALKLPQIPLHVTYLQK